MLTGITLCHALKDILEDGRVVLEDLSDAVSYAKLCIVKRVLLGVARSGMPRRTH